MRRAEVGKSRTQSGLIAIVLLVIGSAVAARPAAAAQASEASIVGQVTDESGAALPGVTVSASSPALQVPDVISITNEQGEYRLSPLPIGIYTVTYTLTGFQSVRREALRLTVSFVAKVDVALKLGTF